MSLIGVYILTTGTPVRIETIHARKRPPRSEITVGQDYTQRLPASRDYDLFVSNVGPLGQAFEQGGEECYRLQVAAPFDDGNSWELACFLAHALVRQGRFATVDGDVDEIVMASGRVDLAYEIGPVEHLKLKLEAAQDAIAGWREKGIPVKIFLPSGRHGGGSLDCPEGAEIHFCRTVAEALEHLALPWETPKPAASTPLIGRLWPGRRRTLAKSVATVLAVLALGIAFAVWRFGLEVSDRDGATVAKTEGGTPLDLAEARLDNHSTEILEGLHVRYGGRKLRLQLIPFTASEVPIDLEAANIITDSLQELLARQSEHEIIVQSVIGSGNPGARQGPVDIWIKGRMRLELQNLDLAFQAIDPEGKLVASSRHRKITLHECQANSTCDAISVERMVEFSTRHFLANAPDLKILYLTGIRYQNSGAQPPFGRYLQSRIADSLRDGYAQSGTTLDSRELQGFEMGGHGAPVGESPDSGSAMRLAGRYWVFPDRIEVRMELRDARGQAIDWRGRVQRSGFDRDFLVPKRDFKDLRESDGFGPVFFQLSSDRGFDPAYRVGDKLDLMMETDRQAWIYCYYFQADGKTMAILPNPKFWQHAAEPKFAGGTVHHVPGETTYPFDLVLSEPTGVELIKCFAVSRDVTAELPEALQGLSWEPIAPNLAAQLWHVFNSLPQTAITEASLTVTVLPASSY